MANKLSGLRLDLVTFSRFRQCVDVSFREAIMLRCVRWRRQVRDAIGRKETPQGQILAAIVSKESLDGSFEPFLN